MRSGPRTIIVDDQPDLLEFLRDIASQVDSLQVVGEARDGRQAVDLATRLKPDLVLMDLHMPHMTGLEAIPHLRQIVPRALIIVVTMESNPRLKAECLRVGAAAVLDKGKDSLQLASELAKVLETFEEQRA